MYSGEIGSWSLVVSNYGWRNFSLIIIMYMYALSHTHTQAQLLEQSANAAAAASSSEPPKPPKKGKGRRQADDKYFVYSPDDDISSSEEDNADRVDGEESDDSEPEFSEFDPSQAHLFFSPFSLFSLSLSLFLSLSLVSYTSVCVIEWPCLFLSLLFLQLTLVARLFVVTA